MIKSKGWNWNLDRTFDWESPAPEVFPLIERWKNLQFKRLLDLGCGIGRHSLLFAQNDFKVDSFDISPSGLEKLRNKAGVQGLNINTTLGDMLELPYENEAFDCVLSYNVLYHTDEEGLKKVLSEIRRILKGPGEAYINFNSKSSSAFTNPKHEKISDNVIVKRGDDGTYEDGVPHIYLSKEQVLEFLKDFEVLALSHKEDYYLNYTGAHFFALIRKKGF